MDWFILIGTIKTISFQGDPFNFWQLDIFMSMLSSDEMIFTLQWMIRALAVFYPSPNFFPLRYIFKRIHVKLHVLFLVITADHVDFYTIFCRYCIICRNRLCQKDCLPRHILHYHRFTYNDTLVRTLFCSPVSWFLQTELTFFSFFLVLLM